MNATKTMTLGEYIEQHDNVVVFAANVGIPSGYHLPAGCEGWEIPEEHLALDGTVDADGHWSWDGGVDVRDGRGNSITTVTASVAPEQWAEMVADDEANC